jgi:hypothetical protein
MAKGLSFIIFWLFMIIIMAIMAIVIWSRTHDRSSHIDFKKPFAGQWALLAGCWFAP